MATPREIELAGSLSHGVLKIYKIMAKKSLGQNFLINKNKIGEIIAALDLKDGDTVVEIGPGHGELTKELMTNNKQPTIIAIEKDGKLAEKLRESMKIHGGRVEITSGDALKILPALALSHGLKAADYKLVGNIPYYITGFLLRIMSGLEIKPKIAVLTVQKEVAERICGGMDPVKSGLSRMNPPHKSMWGMNLLAASVQFWARPAIVGVIPKTDFFPRPKVDSAIIKLVTYNPEFKTNAENYYNFIRVLFRQPRKTVRNNLIPLIKDGKIIDEILKKSGIEPGDRPQNLGISQIEKMVSEFDG